MDGSETPDPTQPVRAKGYPAEKNRFYAPAGSEAVRSSATRLQEI